MASRSQTTLSRRPKTPNSSDSNSNSNTTETAPPIPKNRNSTSSNPPPRRTSLGFLRRSKSGDPVRKMRPVVAPTPPELPNLWVNGSGAQQQSFAKQLLGRDVRDSVDILSGNFQERSGSSNSSKNANNNGGFVPGRKSTDSVLGRDGQYVKSSNAPLSQDPYANIGSMAHRGRYSYASSAVSTVNSPRRVRRRKDPTPFNILIIGAKNSGKTSFLRFLRQSLALKNKRGQPDYADLDTPQTDHTGTTSDSPFKSTYIETEIDGERIGLTLWDSAGLERNLIDLQIRETVAFIENKFEETFSEETKVVRAPGVRDTHIHVVFLLLDPARLTPNNHYLGKSSTHEDVGGLDKDLDIQVLTSLQGKTVVVPVISKADTCTSKHMAHLKGIVRDGLAKAGVDPLDALELEIDDDSAEATPHGSPRLSGVKEVAEDGEVEGDSSGSEASDHQPPAKTPSPVSAGLSFIPLSVISPDGYQPGEPVGRHFPWGFADPYNEDHCDFGRLKDCVFSEWRGELREKSRIHWYEYWRSDRLGAVGAARGPRRY